MVKLKEIDRTAAFAWSPVDAVPALLTASLAGAVNADFSDASQLEIWNLELMARDDGENASIPKVAGSIACSAKFHGVAWGYACEAYPNGLIAGGLEDGSFCIWDAAKLVTDPESSLVAKHESETGPIVALDFNHQSPKLLATVSRGGELCIWDVSVPQNAPYFSAKSSRHDELTCVAWNHKVAHIVAIGGSKGFTTVWELRAKKEIITLSIPAQKGVAASNVSSIAWHPENPTKLATAADDDPTSVIYLWDLRNARAPEKVLEGHEMGVLSLSWCSRDSDLLLSSGKDNKTILWNVTTSEVLSSFAGTGNWSFQVSWCQKYPELLATGSYDGKVSVHSLQSNAAALDQDDKAGAGKAPTNDMDFFNNLPVISGKNEPSLSLEIPPKWYPRLGGARFAFGEKLAIVKHDGTVAIENLQAKTGFVEKAKALEESLNGDGPFLEYLTEEINKMQGDEKLTKEYTLLSIMMQESPRSKIKEIIEASKPEAGITGSLSTSVLDEPKQEETKEDAKDDAEALQSRSESEEKSHASTEAAATVTEALTTNDGAVDEDIFGSSGQDDFLNGLNGTVATEAPKEQPISKVVETPSSETDMFKLSDGQGSDATVIQTILKGQFDEAASIFLKSNRFQDAFLVASFGGSDAQARVREAYMKQQKDQPYVKLLYSILSGTFTDFVAKVDLANWKDAMILICTFASPTNFAALSTTLGERLLNNGQVEDASFCLTIASGLGKLFGIWKHELREKETEAMAQARNTATDDAFTKVHEDYMLELIKRVAIFRGAVAYKDSYSRTADGEYELAPLYDTYMEFAQMLASHGLYDMAVKYARLVPPEYSDAAGTAQMFAQLAQENRASSVRQQMSAPGASYGKAIPTQPAAATIQPAAELFATTTPSGVRNPYAPVMAPSQPQVQAQAPPSVPPVTSPPPPAATPRRIDPPSRASDGWNDPPAMAPHSGPGPRRTPSTAPRVIASPFPNAPSPGPSTPRLGTASAAPPPPPAPGPGPPPKSGQPYQRPPSATAPTASPFGAPQAMSPPPPPKATTPLNSAPVARGAPSSLYAPAASAYQEKARPSAPGQYGGGPPVTAAVAAAPPPPQTSSAMASGPPRAGSASPAAVPSPVSAPRAAPAQYPPGDRTHIAPENVPIYRSISGEFEQIKRAAPPTFQRNITDIERRLNVMFDVLNNGAPGLSDSLLVELRQLASAIAARDFVQAHALHINILTTHTEECGQWLVGIKRLIDVAQALISARSAGRR